MEGNSHPNLILREEDNHVRCPCFLHGILLVLSGSIDHDLHFYDHTFAVVKSA